MKTVAYLRVSTAQQDLRSQPIAILEYARKHDFRIGDFIEATASGQASEKRRRLDELMAVLQRGDRLVVSELSRLGRSLGQIVAILDVLAKARSSGRKLGVINTDQAPLYGAAISAVKQEGILRCRCRHRPVQYLNNILEQDHRAIKRRVKAKQGFSEFHATRRTIQGYEAIHMIRKGQAMWVSGSDVRQQIQFINQLFEVAA